MRTRFAWALAPLFLLLTSACSSSVSDFTSPTSDFWDRRPRVAGARQTAPRTARRRAPPRAFVERQAPPTCGVPAPAPQQEQAQQPTYTPPPRLATPAPRSARQDAPATVEEMQVLDEVNRIRAQHSLRALRFHAALWVAARDHSLEQQRAGYMGHGSPDPQRNELTQRMTLAGYNGRVFAEVVAWGYPDVASVVEGWMNSPDHRRILLDPELTEAAFNRVGQYWTGNLGAPRRLGAVSAPRQPTVSSFSRAPAPRAAPRAMPMPRAVPRAAPQAPRPARRAPLRRAPARRKPAPQPIFPKPSGGG